jgi:hypothetical protein
MKYVLHLTASTSEAASIPEKHAKLMKGLASIEGAWGLASGDHVAPDPGRELSAQFQLGKSLRGRGVRGFVSYRFRGGLRDHSGCDDLIDLDFNPERVDFGALFAALPQYVAAFEPYFASVGDEEFGFFDFNRSRNMNYRVTVLRVYPICFLGGALCVQALGMSGAEVARRLAPKAESVSEIGGGVLVVGHSKPLPFTSAKSLSDELSGLVGVKVI